MGEMYNAMMHGGDKGIAYPLTSWTGCSVGLLVDIKTGDDWGLWVVCQILSTDVHFQRECLFI